jgi:RNA polymerase sigma-70 factor (ECF subfamily)
MTKQTKNPLEQQLWDLVMATRAGDQNAYRQLLTQLTPFLRQAAAGQLRSFSRTHLAEDVVQETLLTIHLKLHTYLAELPFLVWVRVILKHKTIDFLRRARLENVSIDDEDFPEIAAPGETNDTTASRDLLKLLAQLKPPSGEIIHALKIQGASVKDVAKKFNLSESNIKVLVHRGLQKLAQLAKDEAA